MGWSTLQLQHCDVVGRVGAEQRPGNIKSLLGSPRWPVPSQVFTIDPNLALLQTSKNL